MNNIYKTRIFKLSILSSQLLFFSIMYGNLLWSNLWVIAGFFEIAIIIFFIIVIISSVVFWLKNRKGLNLSFIPICINFIFLILTAVLPLNYLRNRIEFKLFYSKYEAAYDLSKKQSKNLITNIYHLPNEYQFLSVGGGDVIILRKPTGTAVLFYTFRGTPDGQSGFVKIDSGKIQDYLTEMFSGIYNRKDLGNHWYYVSGE